MKIITEKAAYVQKNDLMYLNSSSLAIPASIYMKVFGWGITIIDDRNRYEFVKFEEDSEIEFFKDIDWMIDYNEVKDLTEEEMINLGQSIVEKKNAIAKKYNGMSRKEKKNNCEMIQDCELLEFKMYSLADIIHYKRGELPMDLPVEVVGKKKGNLFQKVFKKKGN